MTEKQEYSILVPSERDVAWAVIVAGWTRVAGTMLPKSSGAILDMFSQRHSVLVVDGLGLPVSHAAVSFTWPDDWLEIGAVVTAKEHRRHGAAEMAVRELLKHLNGNYSDHRMFAICNDVSVGLFEKKLGGTRLKPTELPGAVWKPCLTCPNIPKGTRPGVLGFVCCDANNLIEISHLKNL